MYVDILTFGPQTRLWRLWYILWRNFEQTSNQNLEVYKYCMNIDPFLYALDYFQTVFYLIVIVIEVSSSPVYLVKANIQT